VLIAEKALISSAADEATSSIEVTISPVKEEPIPASLTAAVIDSKTEVVASPVLVSNDFSAADFQEPMNDAILDVPLESMEVVVDEKPFSCYDEALESCVIIEEVASADAANTEDETVASTKLSQESVFLPEPLIDAVELVAVAHDELAPPADVEVAETLAPPIPDMKDSTSKEVFDEGSEPVSEEVFELSVIATSATPSEVSSTVDVPISAVEEEPILAPPTTATIESEPEIESSSVVEPPKEPS
jgi:hypothetical protein